MPACALSGSRPHQGDSVVVRASGCAVLRLERGGQEDDREEDRVAHPRTLSGFSQLSALRIRRAARFAAGSSDWLVAQDRVRPAGIALELVSEDQQAGGASPFANASRVARTKS